MEQTLFQNYPVEQRKQLLEDNADEILEKNYFRKFTGAEKDIRRVRNSEIDIKLIELEEEMKAEKERINAIKKPLVAEKQRILEEIKTNGEIVNGKVYKIVDPDVKEVGYYDEDCNLVDQRRMTNLDRQFKMKFVEKNGTED